MGDVTMTARRLLLALAVLAACAFAAERTAESKYAPNAGNSTVPKGNSSRNATKVKGLVATKLTQLSLLINSSVILRRKSAAAGDTVVTKLGRAAVMVIALEKTAPCLEGAKVRTLRDVLESVDDDVANSNSTSADPMEDPMLANSAKMIRIVKVLNGQSQNKSCNASLNTAPIVKTSSVVKARNKTAEIITLRRYMSKMSRLDMSHMVSVEKAMLAAGVEKLNSTERRARVKRTVRQIADEYGVNNDSATVEEAAESLYDKPPPPPPPVRPAFPPGFNETMMKLLRNMSAKADQSDTGVVTPDMEEEEAGILSGAMGKMTAVQMREYMPKLADAQKAVVKEDRRLLANALKLELACKNKTKPAPVQTVNVSDTVRRFVFNITGQTRLNKKAEAELQYELDHLNATDMDKQAEKDLEDMVLDLKEQNRTIAAENNRTAALNNASNASKVKPIPVAAKTSLFGLFGR